MSQRTLLLAAVVSFSIALSILGFSIKANAETFAEEFSRPHSPAIGYSVKSDGSWTTWNKFWFGMAIGGQAADVATTLHAIDGPYCSEANPLLGSDPDDAVLIGVKVLVLGLSYAVIEYWLPAEQRQKSRNIVYGTLGTLGFGAATWNATRDCY